MLPAKRNLRLKPAKIQNLVRSLNVLNVDVSKLEERVAKGRVIGNSSACIIDITCCIIDCSSCKPDDMDIYTYPENMLEGFLFRLPEQATTPEAPVYFFREMSARTAFKIGHQSLKVPGGSVQAHLLGVAGEVLGKGTLQKHKISATAPVIALSNRRAKSSGAQP